MGLPELGGRGSSASMLIFTDTADHKIQIDAALMGALASKEGQTVAGDVGSVPEP